MIYLKLFENHSGYEDFTGSTEYVEPHVSHCIDENDVHYNIVSVISVTGVTLDKSEVEMRICDETTLIATVLPANAKDKTVTWESSDENVATVNNGVINGIAVGTCTITVTTNDGGFTAECEVTVNDKPLTLRANAASTIRATRNTGGTCSVSASTDDGESWTELSNDTTYNLTPGETVMFKAKQRYQVIAACLFSGSTGNFSAEGNAMSLIYGDDFVGKTSIGKLTGLGMLFEGASGLTDASKLLLPATEFRETGSYLQMFKGCINLRNAPKLSAIEIQMNTYNAMFSGCTSLTTAPELPATQLKDMCYENMFNGCTSLNYVKCLATNITASDCTNGWLADVSPSGTFVKDASMSWPSGDSGIPNGWTVEDAE